MNIQCPSRRAFIKGLQATSLAPLLGASGCLSTKQHASADTPEDNPLDLYAEVLTMWCDGMLARQVNRPSDPATHGGLFCPVCNRIHGRCADALYPLMHQAHVTGQSAYLDAAIRLQAWSDNMTQQDGSWLNDPSSTWKGITVFGAVALCDALLYHGDLLDTKIRERWMDRLARAMTFLDGFMTMKSGNINYPVTSSLAFTLAGDLLANPRYTAKGREFARNSLAFFTKHHFLFGEGKPQDALTPKGARPVDLGYNVEESLPALTLYALKTKDADVLEPVIKALQTHAEFMLPDGAWDNSWGSRNYKWTWWGSRTSDGCQPAYALLADKVPLFREIANRNLKLFASCTHNGLLYGGPHYYGHGEKPCIHHTFTHAKALACVLDHTSQAKGRAMVSDHAAGALGERCPTELALPREKAYGLKTYPEIGVSLISIGPWRATLTEYDWEYTVGGQASGGTLSLLYHQKLGPLLSASMTEYSMVEKHNQQEHGNYPTMCLTPRMEYREEGSAYTSLSDLKASCVTSHEASSVHAVSTGFLETIQHKRPSCGAIPYQLTYHFSEQLIELGASILGNTTPSVQWIVPIVSPAHESIVRVDARTLLVRKSKGTLILTTNTPGGFEKLKLTRVFNLVPGLECLPLSLTLPTDGSELKLRITTEA